MSVRAAFPSPVEFFYSAGLLHVYVFILLHSRQLKMGEMFLHVEVWGFLLGPPLEITEL
jgi:hypothetical protein